MTATPDYLTPLVCVSVILAVVTLYRLETRMATNQQRLDALTTQLSSIAAQTRKAYDEIVSKIDALRNQESNLDFSGLDETVARLGIVSEALDSVVPDEIDAEDPSEPVVPEPVVPEPEPAVEPDAETVPVPSDSPAEPVSRSKRK